MTRTRNGPAWDNGSLLRNIGAGKELHMGGPGGMKGGGAKTRGIQFAVAEAIASGFRGDTWGQL